MQFCLHLQKVQRPPETCPWWSGTLIQGGELHVLCKSMDWWEPEITELYHLRSNENIYVVKSFKGGNDKKGKGKQRGRRPTQHLFSRYLSPDYYGPVTVLDTKSRAHEQNTQQYWPHRTYNLTGVTSNEYIDMSIKNMPAYYGYHWEMIRMFDTELRKDLWMATLVRKFSKSQKVFSTVVIFGEENRNPL